MNKDYYNTLGVSRTASQDEIKKAFRKLAHQYHPDKGTGDESKFKEVNEAYQVLSDPKKRSNYDNFGFAYNDGGFQGQYSQGFDFSDLFGGGFGQQGGRTGGMEDIFEMFSDAFGYRQPQREESGGEDLYVEVSVGKKDLGTNRVVEYEILDTCSECDGQGVARGYLVVSCKTCGGSGQVRHTTKSAFGYFARVTVCNTCRGKGKIPEKECSHCKGSGRAKTTRKIEIRIPKELNTSYDVVVPKGGNAGKHGSDKGNLVIHLKLK